MSFKKITIYFYFLSSGKIPVSGQILLLKYFNSIFLINYEVSTVLTGKTLTRTYATCRCPLRLTFIWTDSSSATWAKTATYSRRYVRLYGHVYVWWCYCCLYFILLILFDFLIMIVFVLLFDFVVHINSIIINTIIIYPPTSPSHPSSPLTPSLLLPSYHTLPHPTHRLGVRLTC